MNALTIALGPHSQLRVTVDAHDLLIPADERGMDTLVRILQARTRTPRAHLGTDNSPTQAIIDAWMKENWSSNPLQLAGPAKRRADIKNATGVRVRGVNDGARLDLEGIEL